MNFALVFALLVAIVAVVFAFQNPQTMSVRFLSFESRDASTALILLITYGLGLLTGILTTLPGRLRAQMEAKRAARLAEEERSKALGALGKSTPVGTTAPGEADPYAARFGDPPHRV